MGIQAVAVVGTGMMGPGIAAVCALAGCRTTVAARLAGATDPEAAARGAHHARPPAPTAPGHYRPSEAALHSGSGIREVLKKMSCGTFYVPP